jgi:hypothetical protein
MTKETYDLNELIDILENMKNKGEGTLNLPKAVYCLAKEIEKIKQLISGEFPTSS